MNLRKILRWLLSFVQELKVKMMIAVLLGTLSALSVLMIPVIGVYALIQLLQDSSTSLLPYIAIMVTLGLLRGALRYGEQYLNHSVAFELLAIVRDKIFGVLRQLAPAKLQGKSSGDLIALITSDVELLEVFFAHTVSPVAIAFITSVIQIVLFASIDVRLALISGLAYLSVGVVIPVLAYHRRQRLGGEYKEALSDLNQEVFETFHSVQEMQSYQLESVMLTQMNQAGERVNHANEAMIDQGTWIQSLGEGSVFIFTVLMLAISIQSQLTFAQIALATILMMSSFGPTLALAGLGNALLSTFASAQRLYDLVHEKPMVKEIINPQSFTYTHADMDDVSFTYPGGTKKVLDQLTFHMKANGFVGIMGESGLGKSTMLKLFMRFWKANAGRVEISDQNIEQIDSQALRKTQGYMEQETFLFEASIRFNITLGKTYSDEAIYEALDKASLGEWIKNYPEGLETIITGQHRAVSDGERQRLGLARLFISEASFVLLDEPTSNLDYYNEQIILHALQKEKSTRMILMVSHRETAMEGVDEVIHFDQLQKD